MAGLPVCLNPSLAAKNVGRYSFLAIDPQVQVASFGNRVTLTEDGTSDSYHSDNPLEEIRRRINLYKVAQFSNMPPFTGGAVGYAGYDVVRYVEDLPNAPDDDRDLPDMSFAFYDRMLVFDHITKTITVVALAWTKKHESLDAAFEDANRRIDEMLDCLNRPETDLLCLDADLPTGEPPRVFLKFYTGTI